MMMRNGKAGSCSIVRCPSAMPERSCLVQRPARIRKKNAGGHGVPDLG
jgi:hypothetical protein